MKLAQTTPLYLAEFIGTFFLIFFGCGSVVLAEMGQENISLFIPVIFGGTVSIMIYALGHISGAHFNPAVTIAFAVARKFPKKRIPFYLLSQVGGAVVASLSLWVIFGSQHSFGVTNLSTSLGSGLLLEFLLSFALMFVIISVATDTRAVGELAGLAIGTAVTLCAFVGGPLTGASMNPARSLGPALVAGQYNFLWVYLLVPVLGAGCGALVYESIRCYRTEPSEHGCC